MPRLIITYKFVDFSESAASDHYDESIHINLKSKAKPASTPFQIYCDEPDNALQPPKPAAKPFEIYCDEPKNKPCVVVNENNLPKPASAPAPSFPIFYDETVAPKPSSGFQVYCDENAPILPKPEFVKPMPVPTFSARQSLIPGMDVKQSKYFV